jgi:formylglycine-generating enzyme required for sulfatase activity
MKLVLIPGGKFMMDQTRPEPAQYIVVAQREVGIPRPFYMGIHEVTQEQYATMMNANPSQFKEEGNSGWALPVECVTWHEANAFCAKLSALPAEQRAGRAYRLPTEAEWEYAYRAGTQTRHYFDARAASKYAWTNANSGGKTHPVGQLKPNAWGLYDMNGNVWEWCSDSQDGEAQVLRGSSLYNNVDLLRTWSGPDRRTFDFGFRVVCVLVGGDDPVKKSGGDGRKITKPKNRQQRWDLIFNTRDGDDYLRQL